MRQAGRFVAGPPNWSRCSMKIPHPLELHSAWGKKLVLDVRAKSRGCFIPSGLAAALWRKFRASSSSL